MEANPGTGEYDWHNAKAMIDDPFLQLCWTVRHTFKSALVRGASGSPNTASWAFI